MDDCIFHRAFSGLASSLLPMSSESSRLVSVNMSLSTSSPRMLKQTTKCDSGTDSTSANDRKVTNPGANRDLTSNQQNLSSKKETGKSQQQSGNRSRSLNSVECCIVDPVDGKCNNRALKENDSRLVLDIGNSDENVTKLTVRCSQMSLGSSPGSLLCSKASRESLTAEKGKNSKRRSKPKSKRSQSRFKRSITSVDEYVEYDSSLPAVKSIPISSSVIRSRQLKARASLGAQMLPTQQSPDPTVPTVASDSTAEKVPSHQESTPPHSPTVSVCRF